MIRTTIMQSAVVVVVLLCPPVLVGGTVTSRSCLDRLHVPKSFQKLPSLDDLVVVMQDAFVKIKARSKLDCGGQCVGDGGCAMFTFLPHQDAPLGDCHLHGQLPSATVGHHTFPGARSYAVHDPCDYGYSQLCFPGRCVKVLQAKMNYSQGQQSCHRLAQGHLIMTKTQEDVQCAECALQRNGITDAFYFVGADDIEEEGQWSWRDGTALKTHSRLWTPGEPNDSRQAEDCAMYHRTKQGLNDISCGALVTIICEKSL